MKADVKGFNPFPLSLSALAQGPESGRERGNVLRTRSLFDRLFPLMLVICLGRLVEGSIVLWYLLVKVGPKRRLEVVGIPSLSEGFDLMRYCPVNFDGMLDRGEAVVNVAYLFGHAQAPTVEDSAAVVVAAVPFGCTVRRLVAAYSVRLQISFPSASDSKYSEVQRDLILLVSESWGDSSRFHQLDSESNHRQISRSIAAAEKPNHQRGRYPVLKYRRDWSAEVVKLTCRRKGCSLVEVDLSVRRQRGLRWALMLKQRKCFRSIGT